MGHDNLNHNSPLRGSGYSNSLNNVELPRHRWYPFKEAFSPKIVEAALADSECAKMDLVVDPFAGSGTVPVAASAAGFRTVAYEVNPFFAFLGRSKLLSPNTERFAAAVEDVGSGLRNQFLSSLEGYSTFTKRDGLDKWLFNTPVVRSFEGGWTATSKIPPDARDLVRLALLAAIMDNCNARRDGKCLRYTKNWKDKSYDQETLAVAFQRRAKVIHEDLKNFPALDGSADLIEADARVALKKKKAKALKLIVTSPPYLNSFDYTDVYRPELFLGRFVATSEELRALRQKTVRSHVQASWPRPCGEELSPLLTKCLERLEKRESYLWDRRIPTMVQAYFEDMKGVLQALRRQARRDASLWLVVSTSAYTGVEVPVDLILGNIGTSVGWVLREICVIRHLRTSGQRWKRWAHEAEQKPRLRESVVILDSTVS